MKKTQCLIALSLTVLLFAAPILCASTVTAADVTPDAKLLKVSVPMTLDFTIDPFEVAGRGQIYSDTYTFVNYSEFDVLLTLTDIRVVFADSTGIISRSERVDSSFGEAQKAIFMQLNFSRPDISPITVMSQRASKQEIYLSAVDSNDGLSHCNLTISGNISNNPDNMWESGDVTLKVFYRLDAVDAVVDTEVSTDAKDEEENAENEEDIEDEDGEEDENIENEEDIEDDEDSIITEPAESGDEHTTTDDQSNHDDYDNEQLPPADIYDDDSEETQLENE